jgi:hypothetical protein
MKYCISNFYLPLALLAGCTSFDDERAMDSLDPAEELDSVETSETEQAVSNHWLVSFFSGPDLDLGSASNKTCFITGLKGSLKGYAGNDTGGLPYKTAKAGVYLIDGNWRVQTNPGYGPGIAVQVGCISNTHARTFLGFIDSDLPGTLQGTSPIGRNRACFITSISGTGWGWTAFPSNQPIGPPGVSIQSDGSKYYFSWELVENANGVSSGGATGVCVEMPLGTEKYQWPNASGPGEATLPLPEPADTACGFKGIKGVFDDTITSNGLELKHPGTPAWNVKFGTNYGGHVYCVH